MKFQEKIKKYTKEQIWDEYCGFLEFDIKKYMYIQHRLMDEQLKMWKNSGLGKQLLNGASPKTVEDFREIFPLTTYEDYADILLAKRSEMLPAEPLIWIQTTWEGGIRPIKLAPYSRGMLDTYKHNIVSVAILASSRQKGDVAVKKGDRVLYGGAPLPFVTGLLPSLLDEDISFAWLPDTNANSSLSFGDRIKKGFEMATNGGVDYFFAIGSVANYITEAFSARTGGGGKNKISPSFALRYLGAKYRCNRDQRPMLPKDVFKLKGFVSTGTDAKCYKDRLTHAWGVTPIEIAAGTESTCIAAETWEHRGMYFFPDACFYEFIPEEEMKRSLEDSSYTPRTCLMDEVLSGESYELVISVLRGGAFMRYRIGDVYHCIGANGNGSLPTFTYVDRIPTVIDIAGFTRITQKSINEVIRLSKLPIQNWTAKKMFDGGNPYFQMFIEIHPQAVAFEALSLQVLTEHLVVYFKNFDSDYNDLKRLLNMEPLRIRVLKSGTIDRYEQKTGRTLPRINPSSMDISELLKFEYNLSCADGREVTSC